jgi:hypothetical protein
MPRKRIAVFCAVLRCLPPFLLWKVALGCGKNHSQVLQGANSWLILSGREQPFAGTRIARSNSRFL